MLKRLKFLRSAREERRKKFGREPRPQKPIPVSSRSSVIEKATNSAPIAELPTCVSLVYPGSMDVVVDSSSSIYAEQTCSNFKSPPEHFPADERPTKNTIVLTVASSPPLSPSRRKSWGSVRSAISSLARSSSTLSPRNRSISSKESTDPSLNDPVSQMTSDAFLSHLMPTNPMSAPPRRGNPFRRKYSGGNLTVPQLTDAVLEMCCNRTRKDNVTDCVHRRLAAAISAQPHDGTAFKSFSVTEEEANAVDKFGNILIHIAARWGARVSILLEILDQTDNITKVNIRGETFLHVLNPPSDPPFKSQSFVHLTRRLMSRGFDFCQRDVEKRNFLHHLVLKDAFGLDALYAFFGEVSLSSARFLVAKRAHSGQRLWHCLRQKLDEMERKQTGKRSATLSTIFGDEREFIRRYLPEFYDPAKGKSFASSNADEPIGCPGITYPRALQACGNRPRCMHSAGRRTPLMRFLLEIGNSSQGVPEHFELTMEKLVGKGETLYCRDHEGNTALHYAAEFGILPAVKYLCRANASINSMNNCGNTPLRLVKYAIQRTDVRSDVHVEVQYLRCAIALLELGAVDKMLLTPESLNSGWDEVWDGSQAFMQPLVWAKDCQGLHLLASVSKCGSQRLMPERCSIASHPLCNTVL
jgi:hypothetical protein